jgi:hypothetical protein
MQQFTLIICIAFTSCFVSKKKVVLQGKIAVVLDSGCIIYDASNRSKIRFKIRNDDTLSYSGFRWMNNTDMFIATEYFKTRITGISRGSIVRFDLSGKVAERIYDSEEGEIAWYGYLSRSDKRLLFTIQKKGNVNINPLEGLNRMHSALIMDYNNGQVIKKIENIGTSASFVLHESPWVYDEDRFIYNISAENRIIVEGTELNPVLENESGIYIYDLTKDHKKLLVSGAKFGICSPVDLNIGYLKDQSVWVLSLKDSSTRIVYKAKSEEKIRNIHWTPDGRCIYLVYTNYFDSNIFESGEKLVEVSTGKELSFKKIGHGYHPYSWK